MFGGIENGRHFGDEMLKQLSNKLMRLQEIDLVGQFSSSMLALHIMSEEEANRNFIRLFDRITKEPLNIFGNNIYVSLKIGVARCAPEISAEVTCRNAESALSVAKTKTGTQIEYYNNEIQEKLKKELIILNELVEAIQNNEFKDVNIIYGANYSGKTTLSRYFATVLREIWICSFFKYSTSC